VLKGDFGFMREIIADPPSSTAFIPKDFSSDNDLM
jgi:hypothetical protein